MKKMFKKVQDNIKELKDKYDLTSDDLDSDLPILPI